MTLMESAKELEKTMHCNCDLDNWVPEQATGHSWVCRIHKQVMIQQQAIANKGGAGK